MIDNPIPICRWPDFDELLACYMERNPSADESVARKLADELQCWGFCEGNRTIHLWVSEDALLSDIAMVIGHEWGHTRRPIKKDPEKEEDKANEYGACAYYAYLMVEQIIEDWKSGEHNSR